MIHFIKNSYRSLVLNHPVFTLLLLLAVFAFFISHAKDFKLDASADALLLENDEDLKIFRDLNERYATKDFLFVTFTPNQDLFSDSSLHIIASLRDELKQLELTDSIVTLLDVPLVKQIKGSLSEVTNNYRTLESDDVDKVKAKAELLSSPIYKELIISLDGNTTALQVNLKGNDTFLELLRKRNALLLRQEEGTLTSDESKQLKEVSDAYALLKNEINQKDHQNILNIRAIMEKYDQFGALHLGGVTMISDDMVTFIKNDLLVFGIGVFVFLVVMLSIIFRKPRWVILPLLSCAFAGTLMIGLLGLVGWNVTVISSNFISLMLIITMSMNVHLVVRYRQLRNDLPDLNQQDLVMEMASKMVWPCLYTALTTIMAFGSLVVSGIKPVIDFGWMMTIGLTVTFVTTFLLFPALLVLMKKPELEQDKLDGFQMMHTLSVFTVNHGNKILLLSVVLVVVSGIGISKLEVENSFIDYFSKDTEIYRGLKLIDDKLGGTTSLDIILKFEEEPEEELSGDLADEEDDFNFDFGGGAEGDPADYWFTPDKLDDVKKIHDYLEGLPAVGKVLSLASLIRVGEDVNQGEFDAFELAIVYKRMPEDLKSSMIDPYISIEDNEARINLRILDSLENLRRKELLEQIHSDLTGKLGFSEDRIAISGLLVLYNNMLQSLFKSQILTLGVVMVGIALMLLVLFRSVPLAIIGIIPNILAAGIILGLMGWFRIPLDMMTITIAAITIGIAVDNSIHYIYRFREEFARKQDYIETLHYCHANIGKAVFYTAITIIVGFSILVMSNFIPTIYFGLLTAFAMLVAFFAALTLLPKLILIWKPFTPQK
ncbi:MAG: MMPL family transporter [Proteobacteria bacterium]|nr:MMPL family transporter [Pseudomonadota bacterium]